MSEENIKEWIECNNDVEYFISKYVKIVTLNGIESPKTNPKMLKMIKFIVNSEERGILRVDGDRQVGKTTNFLIALLYIMCFKDYKVAHLHTFKNNYAKELINKLGLMFDILPEWIKPKLVSKQSNRLHLENGVYITAGSTTNFVRGRAIEFLLIDEAAWCNNFEEFYTFAVPALVSNPFSKVVMASTDNPLSMWKKIPITKQITISHNEY